MSAQIAAYGRLGRDAEMLTTKKGEPMAKASIAVQVGRTQQDKPMWLDILAFGAAGTVLSMCRKGDGVTAFGKLQGQEYQGKMRYTCMADTVLTAHKDPGGGAPPPQGGATPPPRQAPPPSRPRAAPPPPPPDDDLDDLADDIPF